MAKRVLVVMLLALVVFAAYNVFSVSTPDSSLGDLTLRNVGYPETFIERIEVDVTSPNHWVTLKWKGPLAGLQDSGPFRSSPGKGKDGCDCNDELQSRQNDSFCTPKGVWKVGYLRKCLPSTPACRFATWFDCKRGIAFHSHDNVPDVPASHGCVRLDIFAAQLIHNNVIVDKTVVSVDGTWISPDVVSDERPLVLAK